MRAAGSFPWVSRGLAALASSAGDRSGSWINRFGVVTDPAQRRRGRVSTLVTLHLPDHLTIQPSLAGLELTVPDRMEPEVQIALCGKSPSSSPRSTAAPVAIENAPLLFSDRHEMSLRTGGTIAKDGCPGW